MIRGRSWSTLAALLGLLTLALGLAACGGSRRAHTTKTTGAAHTRTHAAHTTSTTATDTTGGDPASTAGAGTTTPGTGTTSGSTGGSGSGSAASSGGAAIGTTTTTTTTTTTSTSSSCTGEDCQDGSPTVPGSVPPVNGRCHAGYVYVAAQDGGPALCIPLQTTTPSSTATQ